MLYLKTVQINMGNFLFNFTPKKILQNFLSSTEQKVTSNTQKVKSNEEKLTVNKQTVTRNE